jgi:hypothetical protein
VFATGWRTQINNLSAQEQGRGIDYLGILAAPETMALVQLKVGQVVDAVPLLPAATADGLSRPPRELKSAVQSERRRPFLWKTSKRSAYAQA